MIGQSPDWDGILQERLRSWETEVRHQHVLAQVPRRRPQWQRWAGGGLVRVGGWLTRWGERMAAREGGQGVSIAR